MERKWILHRDPAYKYGGMMTLGSKDVTLGPDATISATRSAKFSIFRLILNNILNQFISRQLRRMEQVVYAELSVDLKEGWAQTMVVWNSAALTSFRRGGSHSFAKRFFGWVLLGGPVEFSTVTWRANGKIPTQAETTDILLRHGKQYVGGKQVRTASRVEWGASA